MEQDGFTGADHVLRNKETVFKRERRLIFQLSVQLGPEDYLQKS